MRLSLQSSANTESWFDTGLGKRTPDREARRMKSANAVFTALSENDAASRRIAKGTKSEFSGGSGANQQPRQLSLPNLGRHQVTLGL
jgi:hypothetical protein